MSRPLQIGITGGIGSGKSFICNIFQHLGIPVYDADTRAKWLMNNSEVIRKALIQEFGAATYNENGLNRTYLSSKVFSNSDQIKKLNAIVHPEVGKDYKRWANENSQAPYLIKEAALMFESGSYLQLDKVICVDAPNALRIKRVKSRDPQRSEEEIKAIIAKQLSSEELKERSDFIINNDESEMLLPQIIALHHKFTKRNF